MAFHFYTLFFFIQSDTDDSYRCDTSTSLLGKNASKYPNSQSNHRPSEPCFKETNLPDELLLTNNIERRFPFYLYDTKEVQSQEEIYITSIYGCKETNSQEEFLNTNDVGTKKAESQVQILPFFSYGPKKAESQVENFPFLYGPTKAQSQVENFPFFSYGPKMAESQIENFPFLYGPTKAKSLYKVPIISTSETKESKSHNDANAHFPKMTPNIADHHQHDNSKLDLIFLEDGLMPGTKLDAHFNKGKYETPLLPHQVAQSIPFSSEKIKEILEILSVKQNSEDAEIVKKAISICEEPVMNGEEKHCATSLESMVDFITSKLGKNVHVISTELEKETKSKQFMVKDGVKMSAEDKIIVCHPMNYPYVVFYCHEILNTTAHLMPLEGEDGARVKSVAVCHRDTSEWDPNHVAFQVLKMKPGTAPVCHILPEGSSSLVCQINLSCYFP